MMKVIISVCAAVILFTSCKKQDEHLPPDFVYDIPQVDINQNVNVGAYFYNYTTADWNKGYVDTSLLGKYSALNAATMAQERTWADSAGVDFFVFNWNFATAGDPILISFATGRNEKVKMV